MAFIETQEQRLRAIPAVPNGNLVSGRQYQVGTGTVVYGGTYVVGQAFYAGSAPSYTVIGSGTVDQIGAFVKARPGYVGQPGLVPAGLQYDTTYGTVTANFDGSFAYPKLATLQPWMVGVSLYSAQPDFWSPLK